MALRRTLLLISMSSLALLAVGGGSARAAYVGNKYVEPGTGLVLEYNVYVPTGYDPAKKYPIMLVMHAANTNQIPPPRTLSSDGVGWSATFVNSPHQATDPSFFMVPISQTNASGWGDPLSPITDPEKFEGRLAVLVLQQEVMTKYSIDPNRLYVTGPSMGGRGTWDILRRYPGLFAAGAPAAAPATPGDAALFVNQNIWAICGEVDPIVQGERDTITAIRALGGNPIYTELAGHGHDSWRSVYPDPQFVTWIYAQRLGVPWWTVSKPPVPPFMGATLTAGWPVVAPPAGLGTSFGGAVGSAGGATAGGGQSGAAGTAGVQVPGTGGAVTGAAGAPAGAGSGGNGSGGTVGATGSGGTKASGGAPGASATGGATGLDGQTGGSGPGAGPSVGTGGATGAPAGGKPATGEQSGGCSLAGGRAASWSLVGSAGLLALVLSRRRRRRGIKGMPSARR